MLECGYNAGEGEPTYFDYKKMNTVIWSHWRQLVAEGPEAVDRKELSHTVMNSSSINSSYKTWNSSPLVRDIASPLAMVEGSAKHF